MRWTVLALALALSACGTQKPASPYLSLIEKEDIGPADDAVFAQVENHARCAGFHRASAGLAIGSPNKESFYTTIAKDAEVAAIQLASAKIPKDLAADMVDDLARTHAARWSYLITADAQSDAVKHQAAACFDMAEEQEEIIREVVKAKYGFSHR